MEKVRRKSCVESTGICWREPANALPKAALEFCQETSLHGVKYICQPKRHLCERIFWLLTLIAGGITAGLLIQKLWKEYSHQPIIAFSPYETTIDQIPFPAVTISNANLLRRSGLEKLLNISERFLYSENETERRQLLPHVTDVFLAYEVWNNQSTFGQRVNFTYAMDKRNVQDIFTQLDGVYQQLVSQNVTDKVWNYFSHFVPHSCYDMIKKCQLNDEVVDCGDNFVSEFTKFPRYCTFNFIPDGVLNHTKDKWINDLKTINQTTVDNMWVYEKRALFWAYDLLQRVGFLLLSRSDGVNAVSPGNVSNKLNWYTPKRQRSSGKSKGLTILLDPELHEYTCGTTDSEGFLLQVHSLTNTPNPNDMGMLIKPNTEVFVEVTPTVTVANENLEDTPVKYRHCYFQDEKVLKTSWFYTLDVCIDECIYNLTLKECNCDLTRRIYSRQYRCELEGLSCAKDHIKRMTRNEFAKKCECLPLCTVVDYTIRMSTSIIDSGRKVKGWNNDDEYGSTNTSNQLSIVHVYFVDEFVYARERKKMYGWVDLVANAGGVLGLCLGFSVLSVLECVYFLTFRLWCQNRRRKTIFDIITTNMAKLSKRKHEIEDVPENRRIQFAINKLHEEALQEMLVVKDLSPEESNPV